MFVARMRSVWNGVGIGALTIGLGIVCGAAVATHPGLLVMGAVLAAIALALVVRFPGEAGVVIFLASPLLDQLASASSLRQFHMNPGAVARLLVEVGWGLSLAAGQWRISREPVGMAALWLAGALALSIMTGLAPVGDMIGVAGVVFWVLFYHVVCWTVSTGRYMPATWRHIAMVSTALAVVTVLPFDLLHQYRTYDTLYQSGYGHYLGPFNLAYTLGVGVVFVADALVRRPKAVVLWVLLGTALYVLAQTYVRSALIFLLFGALGVVSVLRTRRGGAWALFVVIGAAVAAALFFPALFAAWHARFATAGGSGRVMIYHAFARTFVAFPSRWLMGAGFGSATTLVQQATGQTLPGQDDFLEVLLGGGVIGCAALLALWWSMLRRALVGFRRGNDILAGLLLAVIAVGIVNGILTNETTALCMALIASAVCVGFNVAEPKGVTPQSAPRREAACTASLVACATTGRSGTSVGQE